MEERAKPLAGIAHAATALGDPRAMPDLEWTAQLLGETPDDIEPILAEVKELEPVERTIRARHLSGGREFYAQFRAPFELYTLVRRLQPEHIIETGVSSGVSSAHVLLALARNGKGVLHSIDLPVHQVGPTLAEKESPVSLPPGRPPGWAVPEELTRSWDLRIGPSQRELPKVVGEIPSLGLFLHDSLHTPSHLTFELSTIRPKLLPGAVVLADNTEWTGQAFERFAATLGVPVLRRGGSDLVGLRFPSPTGGSATRARSKRPPGRPARGRTRRSRD